MIEIEKQICEMMESRRRVSPCRSNRASSLGHPCERCLVYRRTRWEEAKLPDVKLLYIWDEGNEFERIALRRFAEAGFEITNQQRDYEDKRYGITGHVDSFLNVNGTSYPVEIKSMHQFIWESINSVEDMRNSPKVWTRGYPAQLQLYLYLSEKEEGCFYLMNKSTSEGKDIWMTLDYGYCEQLLQKAERINKHIEAGTEPDRIAYDPDTCDRCEFAHICLPPIERRPELLIEMEPAIAEKIEAWSKLKEASGEFGGLDKEIKAYAKERQELYINVGDWFISKKVSKNGAVRVSIEPLEKGEE